MINKAILIGNLGRDPETSYTPAGMAIVNFSVATTGRWKGEDKTEWHNVKAFGKLAEIIGQYLRKGSKVYIEGSLQTDKWEKDGVTRYSTFIIAREMKMLDAKRDANRPADNPAARPGPPLPPAMGNDDFDDIPF